MSFVIAPNVYALDPHATLSDYYLDVWTAKEGAPSDVLAFTQTPDGWLWLGGHNGLFRFDGVRFERFVPVSGDPLPKAPITTLRAEPNGDLWIGYTSAGLSVLRQGKLTHVASSRPDSPISSATYSIVVDTDNSVWAATSLGLRHYSGGKWNIIGEEANIPPPPGTTDNVGIDRTGQLWVTNSHTVYRLARQSGKFEPVGLHGTASSLIHSPDGRYWHSAGTKLTLLSNSANSSQRRRDAVTSDVGKFDRNGNFWTIDCEGAAVCLWRGVGARPGTKLGTTFVLDKNALDRPSPRSPLYGTVGLKLFEDRDANIWISTNIGIARLRDKRIKKAPIPASKSMKIAMDGEGRAYVHAASQNVWALHNRHDSAVVAKGVDTFTASLSGDTLLAIPGYIQFGFEADARKIPLPQAEGETIPNVGSVTYDGVSMWVYIRRRVFWRYRAGRWESTWSWLAPICKPRSSAPAGVGEVWFGCRDGSAVRITGDNVTKFGPAQGLDFENASFVDARDGILVGGSDGTAILSVTRFFRIQAEDPRVLYNVVGIAKAPNGDRYLNGARGLVYVKAADWRAMTAQPTQPLRYTLIDTLDGYPGAATSLIEGMAIDSAGILWFGGSEGVASLDTKAPLRKASPLPVFVTALETPTQRYRSIDGMVLPPGSSGLRIDYTALGYTMPERIRFRYRLDDVDPDWVEAGTRRAAYYTNLGPGEHRFSVIATNEDGVWNPAPVTFSFKIEPTITQSRPFIVLCVVLSLALVYALHRMRLRRSERRIVEHMRTRQLERERIARLLHDTFLQSVQGLTYAFQGLANSLPAQSTMRGQMEKLLDMAEDVIVEGRNNVSALRAPPARDVEHDLTALAQSLAEAFPVQFSFTSTGTRRDVDPIVADELHLFAREAIFNACRHAQAGRVTVSLECDARFVRLCVRDDGRGIDPQVLADGAPDGHWGLRGLRERAEGMGATLDIESSPGKGTLLCLRIGADMAYRVREAIKDQ
ncbi:sensor histidine kinase [Pseudoduganella umbonata]|uniref:Signal transduction histidine kinase/ligand-binding sensor domain-containing protein n=1 Tax=Pseudoduganella umbonata TaxID=864828 RepID=A0A7W5EC99_9BURK|nr:sensor histidine kinase [Pseudoduganella umbonata]MBB3222659.1 signal transduction histidine kinase/ligand-binding sensor domain-containing protein [Pseudoduganella umbonata]